MANNPSAFPSPGVVMPGYNETFFQQGAYEGMSLRDWFAGQALAGMLSNPKMPNEFDTEPVAVAAYDLADSMLAAREDTNV